MPRLFTGLEVPAEIGQTLSNLRGGLPGARWIDPENYHVTLRFIGDIDGVAANEIASMLFRINRKPFEVAAAGPVELRRAQAARGGRIHRAEPAVNRVAGRTRAVDAALRARSGGPQIHASRDAGAVARRFQSGCGGLSVGARIFSDPGVHGVAIRVVLVPRVHRRRTLRGRGFLCAERVSRESSPVPHSPQFLISGIS